MAGEFHSPSCSQELQLGAVPLFVMLGNEAGRNGGPLTHGQPPRMLVQVLRGWNRSPWVGGSPFPDSHLSLLTTSARNNSTGLPGLAFHCIGGARGKNRAPHQDPAPHPSLLAWVLWGYQAGSMQWEVLCSFSHLPPSSQQSKKWHSP